MIRITQRFHWAFNSVKILAIGNNLKEACLNWDAQRNNSDDLWRAFKESKFYNPELDFDEEVEMYNQFIESLTGEEMFDIMRDGVFTKWEEVE